LRSEVQVILAAVGRFNRFLDGLRDLLFETEIVPVQPTAPAGTPAPTQSAPPSRTPAATPSG
jgi:hypothetical protein